MLVSYLRDGDQVFETYWTTGRGNELMAPSYGLLDLTAYGRQEFWADPPEGWPQRWDSTGGQFRRSRHEHGDGVMRYRGWRPRRGRTGRPRPRAPARGGAGAALPAAAQ
ncbi:MAG TPA: DUF899 family protein [Mycobacteriales bacterium]|nr:DUF899 family protein [Mycobacteriales bacterium]